MLRPLKVALRNPHVPETGAANFTTSRTFFRSVRWAAPVLPAARLSLGLGARFPDLGCNLVAFRLVARMNPAEPFGKGVVGAQTIS